MIAGDAERMLLCDGCDRGFHMYCLKPPLKTVPSGDWFCTNCKPKETKRTNRIKKRTKVEEKEEEEEASLSDDEEASDSEDESEEEGSDDSDDDDDSDENEDSDEENESESGSGRKLSHHFALFPFLWAKIQLLPPFAFGGGTQKMELGSK